MRLEDKVAVITGASSGLGRKIPPGNTACSSLPSITVSHRASGQPFEHSDSTVVSLRGEHDLATKVAIAIAIAWAAQRDGADVLVDLSGVTFMDASTVGALVGCRDRLHSVSQSLELRAPSPPARRVLELCGLTHLVHATAGEAMHPRSGTNGLNTFGWRFVPPTWSRARTW